MKVDIYCIKSPSNKNYFGQAVQYLLKNIILYIHMVIM